MNKFKRRQYLAKLTAVAFAAVFAIAVFTFFPNISSNISAFSSGPPARRTDAPGETNCTACHNSFGLNSGSGNVTVSGLPANYRPGQQIPLTVTVNHTGADSFGFEMTAIDSLGQPAGTYTIGNGPQAPLQLKTGLVGTSTRTYIMHTIDGVSPTVAGTKSWEFVWTAPATRVGKIGFYATGNGGNADGSSAGDHIYSTSTGSLSGTAISNFDNDFKSDISLFRPSNGTWYTNSSVSGFQARQFGASGDIITPGDYDGDGTTDLAVWRPSTGTWYVLPSGGGYQVTTFGVSGDIPVPGDYDGDLKNDLAVWRPSTGTWYVLNSSNGNFVSQQFGATNDLVTQGDYDADGKTDFSVWRPSTGTWFVLASSTQSFSSNSFGTAGDAPVQGDYDGDGKTDIALFRPSNNTWYRLNSAGFSSSDFGIPTDKPAPADYDGDGKTDIAVYRDSNQTWYIMGSTSGYRTAVFGATGDTPVPRGYISN